MLTNRAMTMVSLSGARNAEAGSMAIIVAPSGRKRRSGSDTRV